MKKIIIGFIALISILIVSCQKDNSLNTQDTSIQAAAAQVQAVAVAPSSTSAGDSIYVVNTCQRNERLSMIDFNTLSSVITNYLNTNYSGYTAVKAFQTKDASGNINGYVVIIQYNGNPVGLKFDASGNFVKVLEQREGKDLLNAGWHRGGLFEHRDGLHRDTVAINSLPAGILIYMSSNYSGDTLIHAFIKRNGNYYIISANNGLFVTVFSSAGTFLKRIALPIHQGNHTLINFSALPSAITTYLSSSYPGYVFQKAFSFSRNGTLQGYCVIIDSNNTKYALIFDASGNFVLVKVIG